MAIEYTAIASRAIGCTGIHIRLLRFLYGADINSRQNITIPVWGLTLIHIRILPFLYGADIISHQNITIPVWG